MTPRPHPLPLSNAARRFLEHQDTTQEIAMGPGEQAQQAFDDLLDVPGLRIERIVSHGQASPPGFWYEQDEDEWVIVLQGSATLQLGDQDALVSLEPGDHCWIPAGLKHRVNSTASDGPTIWLAVHR